MDVQTVLPEETLRKTEYRAIDFAKLAAAFFVIAIHIPPFEELAPMLSHELEQVICRLAVPFFFICTGFFAAEKLLHWEKVKKYLLHIIKMYLIWSLLYLPCIWERFVKEEHTLWENLLELLRRFFLIGSYIQLWYLLAVITAILLLFFAVRALGEHKGRLAAMAVLLYSIGLLGNSYRHMAQQLPAAAAVIKGYQKIFLTTRNGIFFGFPFVVMGYLFWWNREKIKRETKKHAILFLFFLAALLAEEAWLRKYYGDGSHDMYLLLPLVSGYLFVFLAGLPVSEKLKLQARWARSLSTDIFLLHMLVWFWIKRSMPQSAWVESALGSYFLTTAVSLLSAAALELGKCWYGKYVKKL